MSARSSVLVALALLGGVLGLRLSIGAGHRVDSDHPVAVVPQKERAFGNVSAGPPLVATFPVENVGGRRLILHPQGSSCACVAASRQPIIIPPGGRDMVALTLQTRDLRGWLQTEVEYLTNDPERPRLTFKVSAEVPSERTPTPQPLAHCPGGKGHPGRRVSEPSTTDWKSILRH
jgi:hypothetical protein